MSIPIVEVKEATDYFRPFPEPESVFFGNIEKQREMLLPLAIIELNYINSCLLYTSPSPRDGLLSRMPSSA